jgi:hypothetical protein
VWTGIFVLCAVLPASARHAAAGANTPGVSRGVNG